MYAIMSLIGIIGGFIMMVSGVTKRTGPTMKPMIGLLTLIGGMISGTMGSSFDNSSSGNFGEILVVIGLFAYFIADSNEAERRKKAIKQEKKRQKLEKENMKKMQYPDDCKKIYNKCQEKNISSFESKKNLEALRIIAATYDIDDVEEAKKMYLKGEKLVKKEKKEKEIANRQIKIDAIRRNGKAKYDNELSKSKYIGKKKYTYSLEKDIEMGLKTLELNEKAQKMAISNMSAKAQKSDSVLWGGVANGLGGLGAGVSTALEIEKKNRSAEEYAESMKESGRRLYATTREIQTYLPDILQWEQYRLEDINDKLLDDINQKEIFKKLKFKNIDCRINGGHDFTVTFDCNIEEKIELVDSPAIIDGSIAIKIYNKDDELVAKGIYNASGQELFDLKYKGEDKFELKECGFKDKEVIKCICISKDYDNIDENGEYRVEIKPLHLWIIEI